MSARSMALKVWQKVKFDPAAIGNEAFRRKLMLSPTISRVGQWEQVPSDGLVLAAAKRGGL